MVLIYTTCRDSEHAKELGVKILKARLATGINIWPMESCYHIENGEIKEDKESVLIIKTNEPKVAQIEEFLARNHTYSTPFVGSIDIRRINREYREWMSLMMQ